MKWRSTTSILNLLPTSDKPCGLSSLFGETGGNINLMVNGLMVNAANFSDLSNTIFGSAKLLVLMGGSGNGKRLNY